MNGEKQVRLHSVIVHETATGYAQGFEEDAYSELMGTIEMKNIIFSNAVRSEWRDPELWEKIKQGETFINPESV